MMAADVTPPSPDDVAQGARLLSFLSQYWLHMTGGVGLMGALGLSARASTAWTRAADLGRRNATEIADHAERIAALETATARSEGAALTRGDLDDAVESIRQDLRGQVDVLARMIAAGVGK